MLLKNFKILAIDPGFDRLGVAVLEKKEFIEKILYSDCFSSKKTNSYESRLFEIVNSFEKKLKLYKPDYVAIENVFFNKNIKTAQKIIEIKGVIKYISTKHKVKIIELTPQKIKLAVAGYGFAKKEDIIKIINMIFKHKTSTKLDDEYDAIACGLAALAELKTI